jgi:hypothetical protein
VLVDGFVELSVCLLFEYVKSGARRSALMMNWPFDPNASCAPAELAARRTAVDTAAVMIPRSMAFSLRMGRQRV